MSAKRRKKERKVFNLYNFLVLACILVILGAAYFLLDKQGIDVIAYIEDILPKSDETASNETPNKDVKNESKVTSNANTNTNNSTSQKTPKNENESKGEVSEEKAKEIAMAKFRELGEDQLLDTELEVIKIQRQGEIYYYISSPENTAEVKMEGGKITRLNSVLVD